MAFAGDKHVPGIAMEESFDMLSKAFISRK